jgi:hypothetical protein
MNRDTITTPPENIWGHEEFAEYSRMYSELCSRYHDLGLRPVEFVKQRLGKQAYCWTGEFRYWVWEGEARGFEGEMVGWRVYVSNQKGICFEVEQGVSGLQATQAWFDFLEELSELSGPDAVGVSGTGVES